MASSNKPGSQPSLGGTVRALRLALKLTQEQVAQRARITVKTLSRIENDEIDVPRAETITGLAAALDVTPGHLDARSLGDRVAADAATLEQRQLIEEILAMPPEDAEVVRRVVAERIAQRRMGKKP
jgi:transcriptional regulator with XRE-family HTH domain